MKINLPRWAAGAVGAIAALFVSSCAYDPSYSSGSASFGYSEGYGDGYGYGGSSFSTSVFVSTGDPRWGYDPYTYSYYDYTRRAYYDPYLYGYYPVGYRPRPIYGVPHPGGWRPGRGHCPPPSRIRDHRISNYRDRESAYRRTNYSWSDQVRGRDSRDSSRENFRPSNQGPDRGRDGGRPQWSDNGGPDRNNGRPSSRPDFNAGQVRPSRPESGRGNTRPPSQYQPDRSSRPDRGTVTPRQPDRRQYSPSGYNSPVRVSPDRSPQRAAQQMRRPESQAQQPQQPRSAPRVESSRGQGRSQPQSRDRGSDGRRQAR